MQEETINSSHQAPKGQTIKHMGYLTHHYKAAVCREGEKLQRRFPTTFKRLNAVILLGVLHGIISLLVVDI